MVPRCRLLVNEKRAASSFLLPAADLDGDGLLDIVAVSYLPAEEFRQRSELRLDSVVLLHQTAPGKFTRHSLETGTCDHMTCAAGAWNGDGKTHLVTGNLKIAAFPASDGALS